MVESIRLVVNIHRLGSTWPHFGQNGKQAFWPILCFPLLPAMVLPTILPFTMALLTLLPFTVLPIMVPPLPTFKMPLPVMFLPTAVFTPPIDRGGENTILLFSFLTPRPLLPPLLSTSPFLQNGKQAGGSNFSPHVIVVVLLPSRMVVEMSNPSLGHSISTLSSTWG